MKKRNVMRKLHNIFFLDLEETINKKQWKEAIQNIKSEQKKLETKYLEDLKNLKTEYRKHIAMGTLQEEQLKFHKEYQKNKYQMETQHKKNLEHLKEKLRKLHEEIYKCNICLEEMDCEDGPKKGMPSKALPCNHEFHEECINSWLKRRTKDCPLCRAECKVPCKL